MDAVVLLTAGTARLLDLLRQLARGTVSFDAQGTRHYQSIRRRRRVQKPLIPEGPRAVFRESSPVKTHKIWRLFRRLHQDSLFHPTSLQPPK